jgi:hypothetical protein
MPVKNIHFIAATCRFLFDYIDSWKCLCSISNPPSKARESIILCIWKNKKYLLFFGIAAAKFVRAMPPKLNMALIVILLEVIVSS